MKVDADALLLAVGISLKSGVQLWAASYFTMSHLNFLASSVLSKSSIID